MTEKKHIRRPEVFQYHEYRKFLRDWLAYLRAKGPEYSMRKLASKAQVSCAYLPSVLSGRRRMSEKTLAKLIATLHLAPRERTYFELLVIAEDAFKAQERVEAMEQIQRLKIYQTANPRENEVYRYLTKWIYAALREMTLLAGFKAETAWIHAKLSVPLSHHEIERALSFLLANGFLELSKEGKLMPTEKDIRCVGSVFRTALRKFHHEMIETTLEALDSTPPDSHLILGHTVAIKGADFAKVKEIMTEALRRIERLGSEVSLPDAVYHVTFLSAPLTK